MANIKELIQSIESTDSSFDEKLEAINKMEETLVALRQQEETAVQDNVDLIVEAIKVMENKVTAQLEVAKSIVPEKGDKGDKGDKGADGRQGIDGKNGQNGVDGKDGLDGKDGVSVTDAKIDFDGSLVITLSTGQEINVGEVVAPDLAEKIKVISTMSTNGAVAVLDEGTSITSGVKSLNFVGSGVTATTSGDNVTVTVAGGGGSGTVTSVGGTGTVNGITLTGTVTSSGNLTLGGTLDLSSPPIIGGTAPAAGTHTTLNLTGTTNQVSSVAVSSDPAAPSAGNLKTFARTIAGGYTAPAFLNATQNVAMLQPAWANKRIGIWTPVNNSTTPSITGLSPLTGTATGTANATTNLFTRAIKGNYLSSATAGTLGNLYQTTSSYTLGVPGTPNIGGFYYVIRFGIADTVASPRTFIGLGSTSAPTNVEPSTLINSIGVGQGAADTNLKIYYGGSAAQTPIDLGSNFPTGTSATDWYELTLFAPPTSNNTVYYQVIRLNTGNVASGTLTGTAGTALPANTTKLAISNWRTNNATASAVTLSIGGMYMETDY
jgi:hypothetical protein